MTVIEVLANEDRTIAISRDEVGLSCPRGAELFVVCRYRSIFHNYKETMCLKYCQIVSTHVLISDIDRFFFNRQTHNVVAYKQLAVDINYSECRQQQVLQRFAPYSHTMW